MDGAVRGLGRSSDELGGQVNWSRCVTFEMIVLTKHKQSLQSKIDARKSHQRRLIHRAELLLQAAAIRLQRWACAPVVPGPAAVPAVLDLRRAVRQLPYPRRRIRVHLDLQSAASLGEHNELASLNSCALTQRSE